jgi:hypothetical protein
MKNSTKTTVILKALDIELRALIQADLNNFRSVVNPSDRKQQQTSVKQAA